MWAKAVRSGLTTAMAGVLPCLLSGCFLHKKVQPQPVILARQTTVPLETPPAVANLPLLDAPNNQTKLPPVPVAEAATKPKRVRRKPKQPAAAAVMQPAPPATAAGAATGASGQGQTVAAAGQQPAPLQVAGSSPPPSPGGSAADTVLGALTPGGVDESPQVRLDAQELLASTDRRLNALPSQIVQAQRAQISKIRNFWKQGSDALKTGDAEGAKTLALKAKLLLDDLEKAGQ